MEGNKSAHLPVVLQTDKHSNVLFFWSGHGTRNYSKEFCWLDKKAGEGFTATMMRSMLANMSNNGRYRKLLMFNEPCYSANLASQAEGIPGVLALCSASSNEQSFAYNFSSELDTWLCDRFSFNAVNSIEANANITFRELYMYLVAHTLGSHVHIYNALNMAICM